MTSNFDALAKPYRWLEYATFGKALEEARSANLDLATTATRALLIGDGDGRFSKKLLDINPAVAIDSIDTSRKMLELATRRAKGCERLKPILADATLYAYPKLSYDFIGLHFSLDCLTQEQANTLLPKLCLALAPNGILSHVDFFDKRSKQGLPRPLRRAIVKALYLAFRASAGVQAKALPEVRWPLSLSLLRRQKRLGGLIVCEALQKRTAGPT